MKKDKICRDDSDALHQRIEELESLQKEEQTTIAGLVKEGDRHKQVFALMSDAVLVHQNGKIIFANPAAAEMHGAETVNKLVGRVLLDFIHSDDRDLIFARRQNLSNGNPIAPMVRRGLRLDGSEFMAESRGSQLTWDGAPAILIVLRDVTDRHKAERALRASEERYRRLAEISPDGIVVHTDEFIEFANPSFARIMGAKSSDELIGKKLIDFIVPEHRAEALKRREKVSAGEKVGLSEARFFRLDGSQMHVERVVTAITWHDKPSFLTVVNDINERKLAEVALQESEARFRDLIDGSHLGILIGVRNRSEVYANQACAELFGYDSPEELVALPMERLVAEHDRERLAEYRRTFFAGHDVPLVYEFDGLRKDGSIISLQTFARRVVWNGEETIQRTIIDLTERNKAEEALRESEAQLRLVTDNIPVLVAYIDRDYIIRFANKPYADSSGIPQDEIVGMHLRDVRGREAFDESQPYNSRTLAGEVTTNEGMRQLADGTQQYFRVTRIPHFGDNGKVLGYFSLFLDLTEHHEREEQLHQAQKMEVVGQLTGGVAHDFNNILMVVLGNLEILEDRASSGEDRKLIEKSMDAASQAAELTHQLLAYSRKQALAPKFIHVNEHVERTASLLKRTLGETISLKTANEQGLWACMADPAQLESAVMNLCLNARDAMAAGGNLTIECANARLDDAGDSRDGDMVAGDYVVLSVTDTGCGMSSEVLAHVFEPFFTTKEVGKGSGLGLSMIYGFAKQSGGHVSARSEEGKGTTISLYLPRAEQAPQAEEPPRDTDILRGSGETVLVIEDDQNVRDLTVAMLKGLDYVVVDVPDAAAAHEALTEGRQVDLVLSDVVLTGGTSGPEFVAQAREARPDLKVIFMSGYSPEAAEKNGFLASGNVLLNKPFQKPQLAEALRKALG